ncbi:MAG: succinate dehydrogenase assembly factor 2 [Granulosicoccus sp.]
MSEEKVLLSRLRWRCRRGMRELDEMMLAYLDHHYRDATGSEQDAFEQLLTWQDPDLYRLFCSKDKDARYQNIIEKIASTLGSQTTIIPVT